MAPTSGSQPPPVQHPRPWPRLRAWARRPFERFAQVEAASGILLLVCALAAMAWTASPWAASYHRLWQLPLGGHVGGLALVQQIGRAHV